GELFNNQDDITTSREVAVFVTAYILPQSRYEAAATIPRAAPPAPAPQPVYSMPPMELERTSPRVDPRYYPPTGTDISLPPAYPPAFDRFPTDRSRVIAPPDRSIISPPAPSPAPDMRLPRSFQDEISRELTRTPQR
ncbi:MAG: hypothetical protein JSW47_12510, partial [Phycisphaerales bacterium]